MFRRLYVVLITANVAAWAWAFIAFRHFPVLLGTSLLAYTFGLRHALDADHLAAIDNVTRKLIRDGQNPTAAGFYFSIGHSTVVILASAAIAVTAGSFRNHFTALNTAESVIGTAVSTLFLFGIALANSVTLCSVCKAFYRLRRGGADSVPVDTLLDQRGVVSRLCNPLLRMISISRQMYPVGFLFGLGFDTATEIGLLAISAAEATKGLPTACVLVFSALFTAGMALVDTTDSMLMVGAYRWALIRPLRKLYYNISITAASVIVAVFVGSVESLGLIREKLGLSGLFWEGITRLNDNFGNLGFIIITFFAVAWLGSVIFYRFSRYDEAELIAVE